MPPYFIAGGVMFNFRGHNVEVTNMRVKKDERDVNKFYYDIRHDDEDSGEPVSLEKRVIVNHWGTMISDTEIDLGPSGYISITQEESMAFWNNCK